MADALQTNDADDLGDVLSSIRRLIAQDDDAPPPTSTEAEPVVLFTAPPADAVVATDQPVPVTGVNVDLALDGDTLAPLRPLPSRPAVPQPRIIPAHTHVATATRVDADISAKPALTAATLQQEQATVSNMTSIALQTEITTERTTAVAERSFDKPRKDAQDLNLFATEEVVIPVNASLPGLIRNVLAEEMQGEMGDRMTRNLRKLIRAEIAMALHEAAQRN